MTFGQDSTAQDSAPGLLGNKVLLWALSLGVELGRVCRRQNKDTRCLGRGSTGERKTCSPSTHIQCILGCFCSCPAIKDHKTNRLAGKRENTLASLPTFISPPQTDTPKPPKIMKSHSRPFPSYVQLEQKFWCTRSLPPGTTVWETMPTELYPLH